MFTRLFPWFFCGTAAVLPVGYAPHRVTATGHGENAGHTLTESNVVRAFAPIGEGTGAARTAKPV